MNLFELLWASLSRFKVLWVALFYLLKFQIFSKIHTPVHTHTPQGEKFPRGDRKFFFSDTPSVYTHPLSQNPCPPMLSNQLIGYFYSINVTFTKFLLQMFETFETKFPEFSNYVLNIQWLSVMKKIFFHGNFSFKRNKIGFTKLLRVWD